MRINEIFRSIQGEVDVGMLSTFVRMSVCNLSCDFCDTKYAKKGKEISLRNLVPKIECCNVNNIVFTGGEPLLQKEELSQLMALLKRDNGAYNFYLETNGTIYDDILKCFKGVSCSPKKQAKGYDESYSEYSILENVRFKFVYEKEDERWWEDFQKKFQIPSDRIYIMPEGKSRRDQNKKMKEVAEYCVSRGYNFTPRIHVLIWGKRRGK